MIAAAVRASLPRSDLWLWGAVGALGALGLLMAYSSSLERAPHPAITHAAARHAALAAVGVVAMLVTARLDYRVLRRAGAPAYLGAAALLLVVLAAGESEYGARRWFPIAGATFQPAEVAKLTLVLALASYASARPPRLPALIVTLVLFALLAGPVLIQPDTGSVLVLAGGWLAVVVAWGVPWRSVGGLLGVLVAAGPLVFALTVPDYQRERLAVFLDPTRDPLGSGFNLRQAETGLGSGGLTGEGLFGGADSQLYGVAARSSDFVFALLAEELGLLGGLLVIVLFGVVAWRGFEAARLAPDLFGRLLAAGVTALILTQAFVNVAVSLRLFPATGLPLPFLSQGGSALLVMFVAVGLLQSVRAQRQPTTRELWRAAER